MVIIYDFVFWYQNLMVFYNITSFMQQDITDIEN